MANNRIIALIDSSVGIGPAMNALAHCCIGLGHCCEEIDAREFFDKNQLTIATLTDWPLIVLSTECSEDLNLLASAAIELEIETTVFAKCMRRGSPAEQASLICKSQLELIPLICTVLVGPGELTKPLTSKFKLYK